MPNLLYLILWKVLNFTRLLTTAMPYDTMVSGTSTLQALGGTTGNRVWADTPPWVQIPDSAPSEPLEA